MSIRVAILWHMHQPFYKDLVSGEYRLPWVRMHGLKDYYGMVRLLEEFPEVHQTFNLVPSLITQLEDYVSGTARDPFLDVVAVPAADLTSEQRRFALRHLFQAEPTHLIGRYRRYAELWDRYRGAGSRPDQAEAAFSVQDYADLQVLSQLAWCDEFFLAEPDLAGLVAKGADFSADDQRFVVAKERELLGRILPEYRKAAERGGIEISTSPFYHPILPLVCDTDAGTQSAPGLALPGRRFKHPEDAREQIVRALDLHERVFGARPRGMWPSEGSVSEAAIAVAHEAGVEWLASDEGVLGRTVGATFQRNDAGALSAADAALLCRPWRYEREGATVDFVFRDHAISDLIGFVYSSMPPADAANHLLNRIRQAAAPLREQGKDALVPIILDGENAWEFYPKSGREFLRRVCDGLQRNPEMEAVTISEALAGHTERGTLNGITPGSWINANFNVWIGAPEDNRSWDLLGEARDFYEEHAEQASDEARTLAFEELLIAEGSDWNWWYGPEHHSANDADFDELYRAHLANVYRALGGVAPESLAQPIAGPPAAPHFVPQTAYLHADFDKAPSYFDWIGAATYSADRQGGAMHGRQFMLDELQAGIDEKYLYARAAFTGNRLPAEKRTVSFYAESLAAGSEEPARWVRWSLTLENGAQHGTELSAGEGSVEAADGQDSVVQNADVKFRLHSDVQVRLPLALVAAQSGGKVRVRVALWEEWLPLDSLPQEGWVELGVLSEQELAAQNY